MNYDDSKLLFDAYAFETLVEFLEGRIRRLVENSKKINPTEYDMEQSSEWIDKGRILARHYSALAARTCKEGRYDGNFSK